MKKDLTETTHPKSVQALIDQNMHKKGYEKAVKEFINEKRRIMKAQSKPAAKHHPSLPAIVSGRQSTSGMTLRLRSQNTNVKMAATLPAAENGSIPVQTSESTTGMTLRNSSRLRNLNTNADTVTTKPVKPPPNFTKKKIECTPNLRRSKRLRDRNSASDTVIAVVPIKELTSAALLRTKIRNRNQV